MNCNCNCNSHSERRATLLLSDVPTWAPFPPGTRLSSRFALTTGHRVICSLTIIAMSGLLLATPGGTATVVNRPNVLLIMTDTQRLDDMGAFGNPVIRTPNLDALASQGVKFMSCYTQSPACMPARATVFTGRYPAAHRALGSALK